jgi:hypothetical protein
MLKILFNITSLAFLLCVGCSSPKNPIIGKWEWVASPDSPPGSFSITFYDNGSITEEARWPGEHMLWEGTYSLSEDGNLTVYRMTITSSDGSIQKGSFKIMARVSFETGDKMIFVDEDGKKAIFRRKDKFAK